MTSYDEIEQAILNAYDQDYVTWFFNLEKLMKELEAKMSQEDRDNIDLGAHYKGDVVDAWWTVHDEQELLYHTRMPDKDVEMLDSMVRPSKGPRHPNNVA